MALRSNKQLGLLNAQRDLEKTDKGAARAMLRELDIMAANREAYLSHNTAKAEFDKLAGEIAESVEEPTDVILDRKAALVLRVTPYETTPRKAVKPRKSAKMTLHSPLELQQGGARA